MKISPHRVSAFYLLGDAIIRLFFFLFKDAKGDATGAVTPFSNVDFVVRRTVFERIAGCAFLSTPDVSFLKKFNGINVQFSESSFLFLRMIIEMV